MWKGFRATLNLAHICENGEDLNDNIIDRLIQEASTKPTKIFFPFCRN